MEATATVKCSLGERFETACAEQDQHTLAPQVFSVLAKAAADGTLGEAVLHEFEATAVAASAPPAEACASDQATAVAASAPPAEACASDQDALLLRAKSELTQAAVDGTLSASLSQAMAHQDCAHAATRFAVNLALRGAARLLDAGLRSGRSSKPEPTTSKASLRVPKARTPATQQQRRQSPGPQRQLQPAAAAHKPEPKASTARTPAIQQQRRQSPGPQRLPQPAVAATKPEPKAPAQLRQASPRPQPRQASPRPQRQQAQPAPPTSAPEPKAARSKAAEAKPAAAPAGGKSVPSAAVVKQRAPATKPATPSNEATKQVPPSPPKDKATPMLLGKTSLRPEAGTVPRKVAPTVTAAPVPAVSTRLVKVPQHKGLTTEELEVLEVERLKKEAKQLRERNVRHMQRSGTAAKQQGAGVAQAVAAPEVVPIAAAASARARSSSTGPRSILKSQQAALRSAAELAVGEQGESATAAC